MTNYFIETKYISAFLFGGVAQHIIAMALRKCHIIISTPILEEINEVAGRKFSIPKVELIKLLDFLMTNCIVIDIKGTLKDIVSDSSDNKIIETAVLGGADYIVTGDKHLLNLRKYEKIKIITPQHFSQL